MIVEEKKYYEVNKEEFDYPKTNKFVDDMCEVLGKYNFDFLDLTYYLPCELVIEYVGDDIEYMWEDDFYDRRDWYVFWENQRSIVFNHFIEALNELKNKVNLGNIRTIHNDYDGDYVSINIDIKFLDY